VRTAITKHTVAAKRTELAGQHIVAAERTERSVEHRRLERRQLGGQLEGIVAEQGKHSLVHTGAGAVPRGRLAAIVCTLAARRAVGRQQLGWLERRQPDRDRERHQQVSRCP